MRMIRQRMECALSTLPAQVLSWMCFSSRCSNSSFKVDCYQCCSTILQPLFCGSVQCEISKQTVGVCFWLSDIVSGHSLVFWWSADTHQLSCGSLCELSMFHIVIIMVVGLLVLMNDTIFNFEIFIKFEKKCQSLS